MRIAIVDDQEQERKLLRSRLQAQFDRREIHAELVEFESGEAFLEKAEQAPFRAVFLDIYMDGITGMEVASQLREWKQKSLLIFTTASPDFALEAFSTRAFHYLVKPYGEQELELLLDDMLEHLPEADKFIELKVNGSLARLRLKNIVYAEHHAHVIYIYTVSGKTLTTRMTMGEFMELLKQESAFYQCSRGVVVNLEHALDVQGNEFIMDTGAQVLISRDQLKNARQSLMDFLLQREGRL